jgi:hypothetical protein
VQLGCGGTGASVAEPLLQEFELVAVVVPFAQSLPGILLLEPLRRQIRCFSMAHTSRRLLITLAILAILPSGGRAWEASVEFGLLTCSLALSDPIPSAGTLPREAREVVCHFRAGLDAPDETYHGTLQFVGHVKAFSNKQPVMMVAKAPLSKQMVPGLLMQKYALGGQTAEKQGPLIGDADSSIVLHPIAEQSADPSLALGNFHGGLIIVLELRLRAAPA